MSFYKLALVLFLLSCFLLTAFSRPPKRAPKRALNEVNIDNEEEEENGINNDILQQLAAMQRGGVQAKARSATPFYMRRRAYYEAPFSPPTRFLFNSGNAGFARGGSNYFSNEIQPAYEIFGAASMI